MVETSKESFDDIFCSMAGLDFDDEMIREIYRDVISFFVGAPSYKLGLADGIFVSDFRLLAPPDDDTQFYDYVHPLLTYVLHCPLMFRDDNHIGLVSGNLLVHRTDRGGGRVVFNYDNYSWDLISAQEQNAYLHNRWRVLGYIERML